MNPRARRLRRHRRESFRKAWRSKAQSARISAYIQAKMAEAFANPQPRFIDVAPWPGCIRTTLDTHTGSVACMMKAPLERICLDITFDDPAVTE